MGWSTQPKRNWDRSLELDLDAQNIQQKRFVTGFTEVIESSTKSTMRINWFTCYGFGIVRRVIGQLTSLDCRAANPKDRFRASPWTYRLFNEPKVEQVRGYEVLWVFYLWLIISDLRRLASINLRLNTLGGGAEASRSTHVPRTALLAVLTEGVSSGDKMLHRSRRPSRRMGTGNLMSLSRYPTGHTRKV